MGLLKTKEFVSIPDSKVAIFLILSLSLSSRVFASSVEEEGKGNNELIGQSVNFSLDFISSSNPENYTIYFFNFESFLGKENVQISTCSWCRFIILTGNFSTLERKFQKQNEFVWNTRFVQPINLVFSQLSNPPSKTFVGLLRTFKIFEDSPRCIHFLVLYETEKELVYTFSMDDVLRILTNRKPCNLNYCTPLMKQPSPKSIRRILQNPVQFHREYFLNAKGRSFAGTVILEPSFARRFKVEERSSVCLSHVARGKSNEIEKGCNYELMASSTMGEYHNISFHIFDWTNPTEKKSFYENFWDFVGITPSFFVDYKSELSIFYSYFTTLKIIF